MALYSPFQMLLVLSYKPLTPSLLVAVQRLPPQNPVTLVLPAEGDVLSCKLPRHVTLELVKEKDLSVWDKIAQIAPTACVAVLRDDLLLVPEALGLACAVAQDQIGKYVTFVDSTGKHESRGVVFSVQRHWSLSPSPSKSFVTMARTLTDDMELWKEVWESSSTLQWSFLDVMQGRGVLCPLPSLAAPLPLNDATNPPGVQWSTLQEFVNKST